jgi:hypothetical protein
LSHYRLGLLTGNSDTPKFQSRDKKDKATGIDIYGIEGGKDRILIESKEKLSHVGTTYRWPLPIEVGAQISR